MLFFMYHPASMSEQDAYARAYPSLSPNHTVRVHSDGTLELIPAPRGQRVCALPGTYLVRVEQDGYLRRIVQKATE